MTLDDITKVFAYRRDKLPHLDKWARSHNSAVADAIVGGFVAYGWSLSGLLGSYTKVMAALNPYLHKRPHANGGPEESGSKNKRWRVDRSGASASLPDHEFPVNWLDRLSPSTYTFDQATSSRTYNNVESTPGSNCISLHAKNGTRDLIDPATAGNLGYAVNSLDEFTDPATAGNLGYAVNSLDEFTDPATAGYLGYAVNSLDEFTDPATAGNLGHAVNSSDEATDQATASFLQSADHQPIHALSNDYGTNQPIDSSVVEVLRWTVNGPDELTDPSTDRFLQGATSATQLYLMDNCYPAMTNISSLPNTSTLGFIDPRTMSNQTAGSALGRMDC
jgi:hypothetical protein